MEVGVKMSSQSIFAQSIASMPLIVFSSGEHHLYTTDGFEQEISIERLFKHLRYNMSSVHNYDIALLKLETALQYNDRVTPVCLPETDFDPGTKCFVTGWGTTANSAKRIPKVCNTDVPGNRGISKKVLLHERFNVSLGHTQTADHNFPANFQVVSRDVVCWVLTQKELGFKSQVILRKATVTRMLFTYSHLR